MKKKFISGILSAVVAVSLLPSAYAMRGEQMANISYKYFENSDAIYKRQMEKLGRGLVAYKTATGIFVTWRLLGDEASVEDIKNNTGKAPSFELYYNGDKIADVTDSTCYLDADESHTDINAYTVKATSGAYADDMSDKSNTFADASVSWGESNYYDTAVLEAPPADVVTTSLAPVDGTVTDTSNDDTQTGEEETGSADKVENLGNGTYRYTFSYSPNDASIGDLDGDGEYELVLKWMPSNSRDNMGGYTSPVYLMAYELDGTPMWTDFINLGQNVQAGAHHTQFLVYDFNSDGVAEVMCQTAPGSKDSTGTYVSKMQVPETTQANHNDTYYSEYTVVNGTAHYGYFNGYTSQGKDSLLGIGNNISSAEYLTVFNGESGAAIDTIDFPVARKNADCWGDNFGNRCNRFLADVAYLDGEKPTAVYWRGYYYGRNGMQRTGAAGINLIGTDLSVEYRFDTESDQPGYQAMYAKFVGQGNHNLAVADVDNDGCDEVLSGAMCLEAISDNTATDVLRSGESKTASDNSYKYLRPRWCTFHQHGDALHIGNYDPTHDGLEFFAVHEDGVKDAGTGDDVGEDIQHFYSDGTYAQTSKLQFGHSVIDPNTGEIMLYEQSNRDNGRGTMMNIGSGGYYQISSNAGTKQSNGGTDFTDTANGGGSNFRIFWDGDLYDEPLDTVITDYDADTDTTYTNTVIDGNTNNSTKKTYCLTADIFGDWREELITWVNDGGIKLRVYATGIPTDFKLPTLMHDPVYRSGVAAEQTAYNQPPHVGYYIDPTLAHSVVPTTSGRGDLYSQDFDELTQEEADALWTGKGNCTTTLTDENKRYNIALNKSENSRYSALPMKVNGNYLTVTDRYVIEFDAAIESGSNEATQLAVTQSNVKYNPDDNNRQTPNYGVASGYLFMLTTSTGSNVWTLKDSTGTDVEGTITIPENARCHYTVTVENGTGTLSIYNLDNNTRIVDNKTFTATALAPQEIFYRAGKYTNNTRTSQLTIDNIAISSLCYPESLTVTGTTTLTKGQTSQLKAAVLPAEADQGVTWSSSNTAVATVSEMGLVTAVAPGQATITAASKLDANVKASCTVTVNPTVTVNGGTASTTEYGKEYAVPVNVPEHEKAVVTVNGVEAATYYANTTHTIPNVTADTTVTVTTSPIFAVSAEGGALNINAAGDITPVTDQTAFEIPAEGTAALTFMMNAGDDSHIKITKYTITLEGISGDITPSKQGIYEGSNYYMAQIFGDGITTGGTYNYTVDMDYTIDGGNAKVYKKNGSVAITDTPVEKSLKQYFYTSDGGYNVALFVLK